MTKAENGFLAHFPGEIEFFVRGELPEQRPLTVAIVGTRKPTKYGEEAAYNIAYELARRGAAVISGLAIGIDAAAHRGALDGGGYTAAVLAGGVDRINPPQNVGLGERILADGGAIIGEHPDGTKISPWHFLERNRIVSGLADAVVIVEAAAKSGTLATARHAMKQGRPVFVVPGRLTDKMSAGCLSLLEAHPNKIRLFTSIAVLGVLPHGSSPSPSFSAKNPGAGSPPGTTPRSQNIQKMVKSGASATEITEKLGVSAAEVAMVQTELELFG
ncbi:DNA-processing protein DprA [Candidatus Saccharibacteria bacterium]|nr:DNA-processing protein DprA [Candidatus Saccharibacteria bacterium]